MTAPVVETKGGRVVVRRSRAHGPVVHPLASRPGVELLGLIVAATRRWKALTRIQRATLRRAYLAALATLPADVEDGTRVPLPLLPDDVHSATLRALGSRGMTAGGRLTPLAVEVVTYAVDAVPCETVATRGGAL